MAVLKKIGPAVIAVAILISAVAARADLETFDDPAAWAARSTVVGTVNFNGIAPTGSYVNLGTDWTLNGVAFHSSSTFTYVVDSAFNPNVYTNWGTGGGILQVAQGATLTMTLPTSSAFSLYLMSFNPTGDTFTIQVYNGNTLLNTYSVTTQGYGTATFWGLGSTTDEFTKIVINSNGSYQLFDNINYGTDPPLDQPNGEVPEPASLLLLGTGLTSLGITRKLRK